MITAKVVFSKWVGARHFSDKYHYEKHIRELKEEEDRMIKKRTLREELGKLRVEYKDIMSEKKELDRQMQYEVSVKCMEVDKLVSDYTHEIERLTLARDICKKSLANHKKEAAEEFKAKHPFLKLKQIQNKIYNLEKRISRI